MFQYLFWQKFYHDTSLFLLILFQFPDPWPWINNCLERLYGRVFRLCGWYFSKKKTSLAKKRWSAQYNTAKHSQSRQNIAATHGTWKKKKLWLKCIATVTSAPAFQPAYSRPTCLRASLPASLLPTYLFTYHLSIYILPTTYLSTYYKFG